MSTKRIKAQPNVVELKLKATLDRQDNIVKLEGFHNAKTILAFVNTLADYYAGCMAEKVHEAHPDALHGFEILEDLNTTFAAHIKRTSESLLTKRYNSGEQQVVFPRPLEDSK